MSGTGIWGQRLPKEHFAPTLTKVQTPGAGTSIGDVEIAIVGRWKNLRYDPQTVANFNFIERRKRL